MKRFEDYFLQHREAYKDAGFWGARKAYDVAVKSMLDDLAQKMEELEKQLSDCYPKICACGYVLLGNGKCSNPFCNDYQAPIVTTDS